MTPRKLYNFYIDPEQAEALKRLKEQDGTPEGESVRRALTMYLNSKGALRKKTERKRAGTRTRS